MRKVLSVISIILVIVFTLSACSPPAASNQSEPANTGGESSAPAASSGTEQELPKYKIGMMIYSTTNDWAKNIINAVEKSCQGFGCEFTVVETGDPSAVVGGVENLCSSGVDGILCMMTGGIPEKIMEVCEKNGVYVSFAYDDLVGDGEVPVESFKRIADSEYYCGSVKANDYKAGYEMTKAMIENGGTKFGYLSMPHGISLSFDNRAKGFYDALKDGGAEMLAEARTFDKTEGAQNIITNYPEMDAFACGINAVLNMLQPLAAAGRDDVLVSCFEAGEPETLEAFEAGTLHGLADGAIGHGLIAFTMLYNGLSGNKIIDEEKGYAITVTNMDYLIVDTPEECRQLFDTIYNGNIPYSVDELKQLCKVFNPNVTAADYHKVGADFTLENIVARSGK
jgi:ABC-type sugar transport system substrate-binding protein